MNRKIGGAGLAKAERGAFARTEERARKKLALVKKTHRQSRQRARNSIQSNVHGTQKLDRWFTAQA